MLPIDLLSRSLTTTTPFSLAQTVSQREILALQPAFGVRFDGETGGLRRRTERGGGGGRAAGVDGGVVGAGGAAGAKEDGVGEGEVPVAHASGVNAVVVDRFEGRYLLSGGANASISMWDLEVADEVRGLEAGVSALHKPLGSVVKSPSTHTHGITGLSFFPFDSLAFLSSSYDHTLKLYDSTTLAVSASFDLSSVIYSHALSPIASHLLVACATQHPAVRLVDLRTGAATHALAGHGGGAVMSVAWSPRDEHILASGGVDGTVRFWDVRRSAGMLGVLDMEDSIGIVGYNKLGLGTRRRERGKAHAGAVNGVLWTGDGRHVVTTGHDERIRVWDVFTGANTLANFGPILKNRHLSTLLPLVTPTGLVPTGQDILIYPNNMEILMYELFEGKLVKRLKVPGADLSSRKTSGSGSNLRHRVTALAWRAHCNELLSAHSDGTVRSWRPRTRIDAWADEQDRLEDQDDDAEVGGRKRKRQVLDEIYRDLTTQKVTFI